MENTAPPHPPIAICSAAVSGAGEVQLFPAGDFRARDGRPAGLRAWRMDGTIAAALITDVGRRQTPLVIDYEHQTMTAASSGQPAPAAGWFHRLEWRPGRGLYATGVQWTEKAKKFIQEGEYRYISPVFAYHPTTGAPLRLLHAGLTNNPALDGMAEVVAAATTFFLEKPELDIAKIAALLGLATTAGEDEILAALTVTMEQAKPKPTQQPDPAQWAPVAALTELQAELAALKRQQQEGVVAGLVDQGLKEGKLLPALKAWATELGMGNVAALKAFLDAAQPIAALTGMQSGGHAPAAAAGGLTPEEVVACSALGISQDAFKQAKGGVV